MRNEQIKKIIEELISKMNLEIERLEISGNEDNPKFLVISRDSRLLIGKNGETFSSLVHLVRKLVEKKLGNEQKINFSIDINGYQDQKVRETYQKIQVLVERARALQTDVELSPMGSYERMIVHEALSNLSDIKTESIGEGKERRVVIKHVKKK
jgi:spoIIIJ-associated protein